MYSGGAWQFSPQHPAAPIWQLPPPEQVIRLASVGRLPLLPVLPPLVEPELEELVVPPSVKRLVCVEPPHATTTRPPTTRVTIGERTLVRYHFSGTTDARVTHA